MILRLLLLSALLVCSMAGSVWAGCPSRTYTYTTGQTIDPSQVTTNEDSLFTYSCAVDTLADGAVVTADLADSAVTSAKISDGTIVNADVSSSAAISYSKLSFSNNIVAGDLAADAVGASEIASGAVDAGDMATTGTIADDKVFVADSSSAGTWRTVTNCTDTGGNHLNYTQSSNSFSCGTSSSSTTTIAVGTFTRDISAASGTQTVSGLGITPDLVIVYGAVDDGLEMSIGFSNSTSEQAIWDKGSIAANTWFASTAESVMAMESGTAYHSGDIGNFVSGAFDIVWTKTGSPTGSYEGHYIAFDF